MTATITLTDRRLPLPIGDEAQLKAICVAVANGTGQTFRVRRPSPDGRKRLVVFRTGDVQAINADGVDFTDLGTPNRGQVAA